jgi:hypothetical protein
MRFIQFYFSFGVLFTIRLTALGQDKCILFLDKDTRQPIAYTAVQSIKKGVSGFADDKGKFCYLAQSLGDSIWVSALGYKKLLLSYLELEQKNAVLLVNEPFALPVVTIKPSINKMISLGWFNRKFHIAFDSYVPNSNLCVMAFITNELHRLTVIQQLQFRFTKWNSGIAKSFRLRLRIMSPSSNGRKFPYQDLLRQNVTVDVKPKQEFLEHDVSQYAIPFELEGVWIGFETVGYIDLNDQFIPILDGDFGKITKKVRKMKDSDYHLSPHIEMAKTKHGIKAAEYVPQIRRWVSFMPDRVPMFGIRVFSDN